VKVLFDVTGVLTRPEVSSWHVINTELGMTPEQDQNLLAQYNNGELDYESWIKAVVSSWGEQRRLAIQRASRRVPTLGRIGGAILREVKRNNEIGLLSTLPNTVQRGILSTLEGPQASINTSNQLTFNRTHPGIAVADTLTGVRVAFKDEADARLEVAKAMETPLDQIVYIGAGSGCVAVMQAVGLSFAPTGSIAAEVATDTYHHLAEIPDLIKLHNE
jgi:hypothetical protein